MFTSLNQPSPIASFGRTSPPGRLCQLTCAIAAMLGCSLPAQAVLVSWVPAASGDWDIAFNWSSNPNLPGVADDVTISVGGATLYQITHDSGTDSLRSLTSNEVLAVTGGSLTVSSSFTNSALTTLSGAGSLTLNGLSNPNTLTVGVGSTLAGTGTVTVASTTFWQGGTISGTGTTQFNGNAFIQFDADKTLTGGRVANFAILVSGDSTINNLGVWNDTNVSGANVSNLGGVNQFNNSGTYNKIGGSFSRFFIPLNNTGTVNIDTTGLGDFSYLALYAGGISSGTFAGQGRLGFFGGTHTLTSASTVMVATVSVGAGSVVINGSYNVPGTTYISEGAMHLNNAASTNDLFHYDISGSGSSLSGTGVLDVLASGTWSGGTQSGTGTTRYLDVLTISVFNGFPDKFLSAGRTIETHGETEWLGGRLLVSGGSTIRNLAGATWTDANMADNQIVNQGGTNPFNNAGTYLKDASIGTSTSTTTIGMVFNNQTGGLVTVNEGTLKFTGGGTSGGTFNGVGTLDFGGGSHTLSATASVSTSTVRITGGTTTIAGAYLPNSTRVGGGTVNLSGVSALSNSFTQTDGTLGGTSLFVLNGASTWTGGTQTNTGATRFNSTLDIAGDTNKTLSGGRTINTLGNTTWRDNTAANNNQLLISGGSILNNSGTWSDENAFNSAIVNQGGSNVFNNNGTYSKTGPSQTGIGIAFNNAAAGIVNVNAGTLTLSGGGNSAGDFAGSGSLQFGGGTHELAATADVTVSTVGFIGGTTNLGGTYAAATTNLSGSGVANFTTGGTTTALNQSGGTLGGGATFQVAGPTNWTGGTQTGAGTTQLDGNLAISGQTDKSLSGGRTLNTTSTTSWSGNTGANGNRLLVSGNSTINNTGNWQDQNNLASAIQNNGGNNTFNNSGGYIKTGCGQTTVSIPYNTTGTTVTQVNCGSFSYSAGTLENAGAVSVATGASLLVSGANDYSQSAGDTMINGTLNVTGNTAFIQSGSLSGAGTIIGNVAIAAAANLAPGNSPGVLTVQGAVELAGTLFMELETPASFDRLVVSTLNLSPSSVLNVSAIGPNFAPTAGTRFDLIDWSTAPVGQFGSVQLPALPGNLQWNTGQLYTTGEVVVEDLPVANDGDVPLPAWALLLLGSGLLAGMARRR